MQLIHTTVLRRMLTTLLALAVLLTNAGSALADADGIPNCGTNEEPVQVLNTNSGKMDWKCEKKADHPVFVTVAVIPTAAPTTEPSADTSSEDGIIDSSVLIDPQIGDTSSSSNSSSTQRQPTTHYVGETITCQQTGNWWHMVNGQGSPNAVTFTMDQSWLDYLNTAATTGAINAQAAENQMCKAFADQQTSGGEPPLPGEDPVVVIDLSEVPVNQIGKTVCESLESAGYEADPPTDTMSPEESATWAEGAFGWKKHGRARTWSTNVCWENGSRLTNFSADVGNSHINDAILENDGTGWHNKLINHWYQIYLDGDLFFVDVVYQ